MVTLTKRVCRALARGSKGRGLVRASDGEAAGGATEEDGMLSSVCEGGEGAEADSAAAAASVSAMKAEHLNLEPQKEITTTKSSRKGLTAHLMLRDFVNRCGE